MLMPETNPRDSTPTTPPSPPTFTRDPDVIFQFGPDADVSFDDLAARFDAAGRWSGEPIPVVIREFGRSRNLGKGAAGLTLTPDSLSARIEWPQAIEDAASAAEHGRFYVEWADDGSPERIVAVLNDPGGDGGVGMAKDEATATPTDEAEPEPVDETPADPSHPNVDGVQETNTTSETNPDPTNLTPSGQSPGSNPRKPMNTIKISASDTYEDIVEKLDGDHEEAGKRLYKKVRELRSEIPAEDQVAIAKADAELLNAYRAFGSPDEIRAAKAEVERLSGEVTSLGRYKELGEFDAVKGAIESGKEAATKLARNERNTMLRTVADKLGYNPDVFATYAAREDMDFIPTKVKVGGKEVDSYSVKTLKDGQPVERPINEVESSDWAPILPALKGAKAAERLADRPAPGGWRSEDRPRANHRSIESREGIAEHIHSLVDANIAV